MIDWTKPIEAVHTDGRVETIDRRDASKRNDTQWWVTISGATHIAQEDTGVTNVMGGWTIRNVEPTLRTSDEALRRMEALVERMARKRMSGWVDYEEARAIVAASKPVDPDLAIAQNIANDSPYDLTGLNEARTDRTNEQIREAILAGVKAGRRTVPLEPVVRSLVANGISEPVARLYARDVLKALDA